jgi:beta-galactosidase
MNLYMFSQGQNPYRRGTFGPTFYWMNALGHDGTEKPLFPVAQKIGKLIQSYGPALMESQRRIQAGVVFYQPYYHDEFFYPLFGGSSKLSAAEVGLRYDPKTMRNAFYFEGMLRVLTLQNRDFEMVDLAQMPLDPTMYPQLWVMALDCMDQTSQQKLAGYVQNGGHLILWPGLPDRDLKLRPCTFLRDALGIQELSSRTFAGGIAKIDVLGFEDLAAFPLVRTFDAQAAEVIARLPNGEVCGVRKRIGKGEVSLLGSIFGYSIKEHLWVYEKIFSHTTPTAPYEIGNPALQGHIRYGRDYAIVTLLNYTPMVQEARILIRDVPGLGEVSFPENGTLLCLPHQGLLLPLNIRLSSESKLIWATCELLAWKSTGRNVILEIQTNPLASSHLLLEIPTAKLQVTWRGKALEPEKRNHNRYAISLPAENQIGELSMSW